jgi:23S rRNA (adenine2503-C2)-methyltransferase
MRVIKELKSPLNRLFIFETDDGFKVESVFYKGDRLCVSSQVGCPVRCLFCASGKKGLKRNLTADEIYSQYSLLKKELPIKGIAIAGIGEPSANADEVLKAIELFKGEGLKVTVSTTGYPLSGFKKLIRAPHDGLTVSVHAVDGEKRKRIFGISESLDGIFGALEEYWEEASSSRRKKFQIGYLLLKGVNDSEEDLRRLGELAKRYRMTVMLMAYNPVEGVGIEPLTEEEYEKAFLELRRMGVRVTLSNRFRRDPLGGCGTLTISREVR